MRNMPVPADATGPTDDVVTNVAYIVATILIVINSNYYNNNN